MNKSFEILLVEDNMGDVILTKEAFEEANFMHEIKVVHDGAEALDYLMKKNKYANVSTPHLILLDINLPKIRGLEVLKAIKNDIYLRLIPVIMLTTSVSERDKEEAYYNHASCYLTKSTDFSFFIEMIKALKQLWIDQVSICKYEMISEKS